MRRISQVALATLATFGAGIFASQATASSQNYCEMFAKDFADSRTTDVELWQASFRNAFNDCMNQYTAVAAPGAAEKKPLQKQAAVPLIQPQTATEAAAVVKAKPEMEPGSPVWNEYCATKYKSFNPETGTYISMTGKERRCLVTE